MATVTLNCIRGAKANIKALRGDSLIINARFFDGSATPVELDLSSTTAKMQVRSVDDAIILEPTMTWVGTSLKIDFDEMPANNGCYKYDIQLSYNGEVLTVCYGDFEIINDVTR